MKQNKLKIFYLILFVLYFLGGSIAIILSYVHHFNREGIGVAILLGAIISYIILRKKEIKNEHFILQNNHFKFLAIIFILLTIPILIISNNSHINYFLPIEFFIIISIMAGIILIQILFSENLYIPYKYYILIEIFTLSILISSSFLFLFPSPYGNDAPFHVGFIQNILNTGSFVNYYTQYTNYPIFHLLFVSLIYMMGVTDFKVIQFFLAIILLLFLTFVFLLIKKCSNEKIALLSILLISTIPYTIQPQYVYSPMSYSLIFFILGLYLFLNINRGMMMTSLFILSFIIMNISHPMTPLFFIIIISLILIISNQLHFKKKYLSITGVILLLVLILTWWMKPVPFNQDLFTYFVSSITSAFEIVDYSNAGSVTTSSIINFYSMILYDLGWVILSFLGIIGAFYGIRRILANEKPKNDNVYFFIITLLLIPTPYVLAIIYPQSMPDRWFPFIGLFIGISASFGVFTIFKHVGRNKLGNILLVLIVIMGIFFNITTPIVNPNSHLYSTELSGRSALTYSELNSVNFISSYSTNISNVKGNSKYLALAIENANQSSYIDPSKFNTYSNGILVVRSYDLENGFTIPLYGIGGSLLKTLPPNDEFIAFLNNSDEIYSNGEVKMYNN